MNGASGRAVVTWALALGLLPAISAASAEGDLSRCPAGAIAVAPGQSIQDAVDAAKPGATFCLKNGIHRLQPTRPKPSQRFYGEGQAVLNGSRILRGFEREGSYWVLGGQVARSRRQGYCMKTSPACGFPETLFIDNEPLTRVMRKNELAPGRFFWDLVAAKLYLADDPGSRTVELAVAAFAFAGGASNVVISDVLLEKFASPAQRGAIDAQDGVGWIIENCEVRWNSSAGISVGRDTVVRDCYIHHNGQIGITGAGDGIRIEGNRISNNNTRGFSIGWEAGGAKISLADGVLFRANHVHDNRGPGLWCDGDCRNVVYEDNVVERNADAGIYHEISFGAVIRNNILRHNGEGSDGWFWGDDIIVAASEGVEIHNNRLTVSAGRCAIMLIDQGRDDNGRLYKTRSNRVYDNDITFEGAPCAGGASDVEPGHENFSIISDGQNSFDRNVYRIPRTAGAHRFVWGHDQGLDWDALRRAGLELNGRLILY
ncbi:MAG: right-handed parallel beta-helix repeat-containing protein [Xanthobacteraceae bacterium]|nr:right-handed parallel beta-helix repeat-containing protein [Xanthobacteraceae bacterium]